VRGSFFDGIVSTDSGGPHDIGQYQVAEPFFKELDALWASKHIPHLSCQFFKLGYIGIYVIVFEFEFSDLCSGLVFSCGVQILNFEFLKKKVP
jgi:hypothetical protein